MLNAVTRDQTPGFMKSQQWPCPGNNPTIGITFDYQTLPERDTTVADLMWSEGPIKTTLVPSTPLWLDTPPKANANH
eukprot:8006028-Karenia_brevis.AAC.1